MSDNESVCCVIRRLKGSLFFTCFPCKDGEDGVLVQYECAGVPEVKRKPDLAQDTVHFVHSDDERGYDDMPPLENVESEDELPPLEDTRSEFVQERLVHDDMPPLVDSDSNSSDNDDNNDNDDGDKSPRSAPCESVFSLLTPDVMM